MGRDDSLDTIFDKLKEAGYATIMAGKRHFGKTPEIDVVLSPDERELGKLGSSDSYLNDRSFDDEQRINPDAVVVDQCIAAIDKAKDADAPFFAFCSLNAPHTPLIPPRRCIEAIDPDALPNFNYTPGEETALPSHQRWLLGLDGGEQSLHGVEPSDPANWTEAIGRTYAPQYRESIDQWRRRYYASALYADELLGRMLDYLGDSGLASDTLVIFTSDHGQQYFDHGFNDKHCWYDESWRVPLVMRHPGKLPAGESREFASWMDLPATITGAAGEDWPVVHGFDLYSQLIGGVDSPRNCVAGTLFKSCALVTRKWKIEYYLDEGTGRLFDREADPEEQTDLWRSPALESIRDKLTIALLRWRSDIESVGVHQGRLTAKPDAGPEGVKIVANRVVDRVARWRGDEVERSLCEAIVAIETVA